MRRVATSVAAAAFAVALLPALGIAGWRSADRPARDDEVTEEPCRRDDAVDPAWQSDGQADWQADRPDRRPYRRIDRYGDHADAMRPQATRPYWGTMRPYWNAPEPPGVIHRQPRTAPLKIQK